MSWPSWATPTPTSRARSTTIGVGDWSPRFDVYHPDMAWGHIFRLRDGKVVRLVLFASRERALEYVQSVEAEAAQPAPEKARAREASTLG